MTPSLKIEAVTMSSLVKKYGTPLYAYSKKSIIDAYQQYENAFQAIDHMICYAVKANSNLSIIKLLASLGSGFDIVSQGELYRVIKAGGDPKKVIFSGVGKTRKDLQAALNAEVYCINIESEAELYMLNEEAEKLGKIAPISFRVNPDVDAKTHPYISTGLRENKFGIPIQKAVPLYEIASQLSHIKIKGIDCHIGSQLTEIAPYRDAIDRVINVIDKLKERGIELSHMDIGGGIGINYHNDVLINYQDFAMMVKEKIGNRPLKVMMEPGRSIVGDAGYLLTEVILTKSNEDKHFAVVDAAMNDLIRPSLYQAWMKIENIAPSSEPVKHYDIVGPICETGDFLGKDRALSLKQGDVLVVTQAGAYGFTMSSNYNSRGRSAEVLVDGEQDHLIHRRESYDDLIHNEILVEF